MMFRFGSSNINPASIGAITEKNQILNLLGGTTEENKNSPLILRRILFVYVK